jgi:hypothetical protein
MPVEYGASGRDWLSGEAAHHRFDVLGFRQQFLV